jgi:hypothetical protein
METGLSSNQARISPHPASDCPSGKLGSYYRKSVYGSASFIFFRNVKEMSRIFSSFGVF